LFEDLRNRSQRLETNLTDSISNVRIEVRNAIGKLHHDLVQQILHLHQNSKPIGAKILRSEVLTPFEDLRPNSQELGNDLIGAIADLRVELRETIDQLNENLAMHNSLELDVLSNSTERNISERFNNNVKLATKLVNSKSTGTYFATCLKVLEGLTFNQLDYRHSQICAAHPATFEWVFATKFRTWLQSPKPIFWISGKPGSGKSTLMKFLVDNPDTSVILQRYSEPQKIATASYYFWINGNVLQRSQEGLLRALLYDVLRRFPDLIQSVLPKAWDLSETTMVGHETLNLLWSRADLLNAFKRLGSQNHQLLRICFFIDGLDEYDGDHDDLVETIRYLTKSNIKLCVASRPWNVFEDAFGQDPEFKIYLQDFNRHDIEVYVADKLQKLPSFKKLRASHADADKITTEIIEKSRGVFLWVHLVVRSLIDGLRNCDRISQLQARLRQFPSDLEQFFRYMFLSMDQTYHIQTAHMFQVALAALEPPSPLTYWFLDEEEDNPDIAISMPIKAITMQDIEDKTEEVYRRVNGRCKGLLEVTEHLSDGFRRFQVDFLHRTVKDFFLLTDLRGILVDWQKNNFNVFLAIVKASLAELKAIVTISPAEAPSVMLPVRNCFHAAKSYEKCMTSSPMVSQTLTVYLSELEQTMNKHTRLYSIQLADHPSDRWSYVNFTQAVVANDLQTYTMARLRSVAKTSSRAQKKQLLMVNTGSHSTRLTQEMILLILSTGPKVDLDCTLQKHVAHHLKSCDAETVATTVKSISQLVPIRTRKNGNVDSDELQNLLMGTLSEAQLDDVLKNIRRGNFNHRIPFLRWRS
jgi:hypothetical protein